MKIYTKASFVFDSSLSELKCVCAFQTRRKNTFLHSVVTGDKSSVPENKDRNTQWHYTD
jgi:hypothetical protein